MMSKTDQASLPMAQAIKCMKIQAKQIEALERRIRDLEKLLREWQELFVDGAVNCGEEECYEQWRKTEVALRG